MNLLGNRNMAAGVLLVGSLLATGAQAQSKTDDAALAGIKQSLSAWSDAYNHHDPHACGQRFTEDAHMISLAGLSFEGRKVIEDHYTHTFGTTLTNAQRTDTVQAAKFLSPDVVAVDDAFQITGSTSKVEGDNSVLPTRHGILAMIFVKQNGQWLVAVSHEMEYPDRPKKH